jgi:nitrite reductase/ring-hydroxylating ferredoxin subunit
VEGAASAPGGAAGSLAAEPRLTRIPQSWYLLCHSRDLAAQRIVSREILGHRIVVFRGASGAITAMDARCAHMGAHLGRGEVIGDRIRCALHHWTCDSKGVCRPPGGHELRAQNIYPAVERHGAIFMFAGTQPRFALPSLSLPGDRAVRVIAGRSHSLETSWGAIATNAFDVGHMQAVHARALREEPQLTLVGGDGLQMDYASRVTGTGLSDRIMRRLSRDRIRATITCWGGTIIVVRSRVGVLDTRLMLCVTPTTAGVDVTPLVGIPAGAAAAIDALTLRATRWLFTSFLSKDLVPLAGMRLRVDGALAQPGPLGWAARWLLTLPAAPFDEPDDFRAESVQTSCARG